MRAVILALQVFQKSLNDDKMALLFNNSIKVQYFNISLLSLKGDNDLDRSHPCGSTVRASFALDQRNVLMHQSSLKDQVTGMEWLLLQGFTK